ncbi:hypothetical protein ACA910_018162 [Epithemia clementina (nom. ined.)]
MSMSEEINELIDQVRNESMSMSEEINELIDQVRDEFSEAECEVELIDAARYDDMNVVQAILHVHPGLHQCKDNHGNTPLHMSAANGHVKVTQVLLRYGADVTATNESGNTPLHWASTNGHDALVQLLLKSQDADVLQQNQFGRSALTEGFTSQNMDVVKLLLDHESASEERLIQPTAGNKMFANSDDEAAAGSFNKSNGTSNSIVHELNFQGVDIDARELAMAESEEDAILGQVDPSDDTTGLGIWASSLVLAQWLVAQVRQKRPWTQSSTLRVLELGAGCGVPSLAIAKAFVLSRTCNDGSEHPLDCQIYATDFNPKTVENLQYNIEKNQNNLAGSGVTIEATLMNWHDPDTWPKEPVDCIIGSDLIYQSDMVPLLIDTIVGLLRNDDVAAEPCRFFYVARTDGQRQGHKEFLTGMEAANFIRREQLAPTEYTHSNPLKSQDDDLCYLHFHELQATQYTLYEFSRSR